MNISEKVAYLKGLVEGMELSDSSKEGKVLVAMLELLEDMADSIDVLEFDMDIVADELDSMDEELELLLEEEFGDEDDHYGHGGHRCRCDDDDYDGEIYQVTCPNCEEEILLDEDMLDDGELFCPACNQSLEIDLDGEVDDDDDDDDDDD